MLVQFPLKPGTYTFKENGQIREIVSIRDSTDVRIIWKMVLFCTEIRVWYELDAGAPASSFSLTISPEDSAAATVSLTAPSTHIVIKPAASSIFGSKCSIRFDRV